jgi:uncharacterized membrane protein YccC
MTAFSFNTKALLYISRIVIGCMIVWWSLYFLPDNKKLFALISVIVVTEPDIATLRDATKSRILNTIVGCVLGLIFIHLSATFLSMLIAISVSVVISTSFKKYPSSWKLAPVTVMLVMISALSENLSWREVSSIALSRTGEILFGSMVAFLLGITAEYVRKKLNIRPF